MQAWHCRRALTIYNDIVRRLHLPREAEIRRLLANTGVDLSFFGPSSKEELELEQEAEVHAEEEQYESEAEECSDPCYWAQSGKVT